jgi:hypothetical protein
MLMWFKLNILFFFNLEKLDLHGGSYVLFSMSITLFAIFNSDFFFGNSSLSCIY